MPRNNSRRSSSRGYTDRKVETRELRQIFLIICEGEKTEPNYFKSFRVSTTVKKIDVRGFGYNPSKLVQEAKKLKSQEDYDQVWCVFDRDDWPKEILTTLLQTLKEKDLKLLILMKLLNYGMYCILNF